MTRKNALLKAICILRELAIPQLEKDELIDALQLCFNELPFAKWSEKAIFDACDQFILDHGRGIGIKDFEMEGLPSHPTIKNRFGITAKEFRDKYYPIHKDITTKSPFCTKSKEEWKTLFINEFSRIQPTGQDDYNSRRNKTLPGWITLARMFNLKTWNQLLDFCNLKKHNEEIAYNVTFYSECDENIKKIEEKIKRISA